MHSNEKEVGKQVQWDIAMALHLQTFILNTTTAISRVKIQETYTGRGDQPMMQGRFLRDFFDFPVFSDEDVADLLLTLCRSVRTK